MILSFSTHGWDDYLYWQKVDKKMVKRINQLIQDCLRNPFEGIGKPEPLRNNLTGFWSRRIDNEHRLIYQASEDRIHVIQCRFHY